MAHSSGITADQAALDAFTQAQSDSAIRALVFRIDQERIALSESLEAVSSASDDWGVLSSVLHNEPLYIIYRLDESWIFISYVPDAAPVRAKMLLSSSTATFTRALATTFADSLWANSPADLTAEAYSKHTRHQQASAMSKQEKERADIAFAEGTQIEGTQAKRSMTASAGSASVGLAWTQEAEDAVRLLAARSDALWNVVLSIDVASERIALLSDSEQLTIPNQRPSYTLSTIAGAACFVYCCPSASPVKSRLIASSSLSGVQTRAATLGFSATKRIETSEPAEITAQYLKAEMGLEAQAQDSIQQPVEKSFAKPRRPGRK